MADYRRPSAVKRQGFLEGLIAKKGKGNVAKDEPARDSIHSLPNGIFSIEAMRFSSLFLGLFGKYMAREFKYLAQDRRMLRCTLGSFDEYTRLWFQKPEVYLNGCALCSEMISHFLPLLRFFFSDAYQFKGEKGDVRLSLNNDENKFNLGGTFGTSCSLLYCFNEYHF
jgi:hypothetical protein